MTTPSASRARRAAAATTTPDHAAAAPVRDRDDKRASFSLTDDGAIDLDKLRDRPSSKEKLRKLLTPDVLKELGIADAPAVATSDAASFDEKMVGDMLDMLYDGLASATMVNLAARGVPEHIAAVVKLANDEREKMRAAHIALLKKYDLLATKWAVEINAVGTVAMVVAGKVLALKTLLDAMPVGKSATPGAQAAAARVVPITPP